MEHLITFVIKSSARLEMCARRNSRRRRSRVFFPFGSLALSFFLLAAIFRLPFFSPSCGEILRYIRSARLSVRATIMTENRC